MSKGKIKLVAFRVGDDQFAADIFSVERVLRHARPRPVPDLPAWLEGLIDYEGRVIPVISLRERFGVAGERPEGARTMVCVVGDSWIAMTVDSVQEVVTIDEAQLEPPPAIFRGLAREYLKGLVRRPEGVLVALDVAHLLTSHERLQLDRATGAGAAR
jgi:purine-binding chemotaxis protein CheW